MPIQASVGPHPALPRKRCFPTLGISSHIQENQRHSRLGQPSWHIVCRVLEVEVKSTLEQSPQEPGFNGMHVLVVEDDEDLRSLIYVGLLLQGMSGDAAADGLEGLKYALERKYDVVISDIRLPGLGGIDLARRICKQDGHPKIVLLTAFANPQMIKDGIAAGACRVLSKPIGLKVLAQVVYEVVGQSPQAYES